MYSRISKTKSKILGLLIGLALISGGFLAARIYWRQYSQARCDLAAGSFSGCNRALERLWNELVDQNVEIDEKVADQFVRQNLLQYLVGPYYGFRGGSEKCGVLFRIRRHRGVGSWVLNRALKRDTSRSQASTISFTPGY